VSLPLRLTRVPATPTFCTFPRATSHRQVGYFHLPLAGLVRRSWQSSQLPALSKARCSAPANQPISCLTQLLLAERFQPVEASTRSGFWMNRTASGLVLPILRTSHTARIRWVRFT